MSTRTGVAPSSRAGSIVATNVFATVTISRPGPSSSARYASMIAAVPLDVATAWRVPHQSAKRRSKPSMCSFGRWKSPLEMAPRMTGSQAGRSAATSRRRSRNGTRVVRDARMLLRRHRDAPALRVEACDVDAVTVLRAFRRDDEAEPAQQRGDPMVRRLEGGERRARRARSEQLVEHRLAGFVCEPAAPPPLRVAPADVHRVSVLRPGRRAEAGVADELGRVDDRPTGGHARLPARQLSGE